MEKTKTHLSESDLDLLTQKGLRLAAYAVAESIRVEQPEWFQEIGLTLPDLVESFFADPYCEEKNPTAQTVHKIPGNYGGYIFVITDWSCPCVSAESYTVGGISHYGNSWWTDFYSGYLTSAA